jgi:hypothetical protein
MFLLANDVLLYEAATLDQLAAWSSGTSSTPCSGPCSSSTSLATVV